MEIIITKECMSVLLVCLLINGRYAKADTDVLNELRELKKTVEGQSQKMEVQEKTIAKLQDRITFLEERPTGESLEDFVGFSAFLASGDQKLTADMSIPFEGYQTNYGNHYDQDTGKFTIPTDGIYYFTFTIYTSGLNKDSDYFVSSGTLIVEDDPVVETFVKNGIEGGFMSTQASNAILMQCKKGQKVWVESVQQNNRMYGTVSARRTTFTGIRMVNLEKVAKR